MADRLAASQAEVNALKQRLVLLEKRFVEGAKSNEEGLSAAGLSAGGLSAPRHLPAVRVAVTEEEESDEDDEGGGGEGEGRRGEAGAQIGGTGAGAGAATGAGTPMGEEEKGARPKGPAEGKGRNGSNDNKESRPSARVRSPRARSPRASTSSGKVRELRRMVKGAEGEVDASVEVGAVSSGANGNTSAREWEHKLGDRGGFSEWSDGAFFSW